MEATAYSAAEWSDLFVAGAGAAAALTGLLFVAVSINVDRIISLSGLPERALGTLALLLGVLVVCLLGLIPQSGGALGVELIATGLAFAGATAMLSSRSLAGDEQRSWIASRYLIAVAGTVPYAIAGITLLAGGGGGLYWLIGGAIAAIVGGVITAWVLLVEILR